MADKRLQIISGEPPLQVTDLLQRRFVLCRTESIYSPIRLDFATSESIFEFSSFCPVANKQFPNRRTAVSLYENSSSPIGKLMRQYYQCLPPISVDYQHL